MRKGRAENVRERKEAGASFGSGGDFFYEKALSSLCLAPVYLLLLPSSPPPPPSLPPQ